MPRRDPLSVRYDGVVAGLLDRAKRSGRPVRAWVTSPTHEYRTPDRGGRTAHERAFTRSAYHEVWGPESPWSLKLSWGSDSELKPSARGKMARPVLVRVFPRDDARVKGPRWVGTSRQSTVGHRIDD